MLDVLKTMKIKIMENIYHTTWETIIAQNGA